MDNPRKGNLAVASAIRHFVSAGHTVSIPLTDTAGYDLVVECGGTLRGSGIFSTILATIAALQRNL